MSGKSLKPKTIVRFSRMCTLVSVVTFLLFFPFSHVLAQNNDWIDGRPDGCTTITVGRKASAEGWVTTSHTCDSHRTRSWLDIMPAKDHKVGSMVTLPLVPSPLMQSVPSSAQAQDSRPCWTCPCRDVLWEYNRTRTCTTNKRINHRSQINIFQFLPSHYSRCPLLSVSPLVLSQLSLVLRL